MLSFGLKVVFRTSAVWKPSKYAKICCLYNGKLMNVMMTVSLPQLQAEKHFVVSSLVEHLDNAQAFHDWNSFVLASDGHDFVGIVLAWLVFGVQFLTEPNKAVGLTAPPSSDIHTQDMFIYSLSVRVCVYLSLCLSTYAECISDPEYFSHTELRVGPHPEPVLIAVPMEGYPKPEAIAPSSLFPASTSGGCSIFDRNMCCPVAWQRGKNSIFL